MPPRVPFPTGRPGRDAIDELPTPDLVDSHSRQSTARPTLGPAISHPSGSEGREDVTPMHVRPMRTGGPMNAERRAQLRQERGFPSLPTQQTITIADGIGRAGPEYHFTRRTAPAQEEDDESRDRPLSLDSSFNPPSLHALPSDMSIVPGQPIPGIVPSNSIQSVISTSSAISSRFRLHATPGPPINLAPARSPNQFVTPPAQIGRQRRRRVLPQPATNSSIESYGTDVHSDLQPDGEDTPEWPTPSTDDPSSVVDQTPRSGAESTPDSINANVNANYLTPASASTQSDMVARVFGSGSAWSDASPGPGSHYQPSPLAQIDDMDDVDDEVIDSEIEQQSTRPNDGTTMLSDDPMISPGLNLSPQEETEAGSFSSMDNATSTENVVGTQSNYDQVRDRVRAMNLEGTLEESDKMGLGTQPTQISAPESTNETETRSQSEGPNPWETEQEVLQNEMERLANSPTERERKRKEFEEAMKARDQFSKRQKESDGKDRDSDNDSSDWEAKSPKLKEVVAQELDTETEVPTQAGVRFEPASTYNASAPSDDPGLLARTISIAGPTNSVDPVKSDKSPRRSLSVKFLNRKGKAKAADMDEESPEDPEHELSFGEVLAAGGPPSPVVPIISIDKGKGRLATSKSHSQTKDNDQAELKRGSSFMRRFKSLDKSLRGKSTAETSSKKQQTIGPSHSFMDVDISPTTSMNAQTRSKDGSSKGTSRRWSTFLQPSTSKSGTTPPPITQRPSITDSKLRYRIPGPDDAEKPTKEVPDPFRRAMPGDDLTAEPTAIVVDEEPAQMQSQSPAESQTQPRAKRESMLAPIKKSFSTFTNPLGPSTRRPQIDTTQTKDRSPGDATSPGVGASRMDIRSPVSPLSTQSPDSTRGVFGGRGALAIRAGMGLLDAFAEVSPATRRSNPQSNIAFRNPFVLTTQESPIAEEPASSSLRSYIAARDPFANFAWQSQPSPDSRRDLDVGTRGRTQSGQSTRGSNVITAAQRVALEYTEEQRRRSSPGASVNSSPAWSSRREREASRASSSLLPTESGLSDRLFPTGQRLAGAFALQPRSTGTVEASTAETPDAPIPRAVVCSPTPPPPGRARTGPVPPFRSSSRGRPNVVQIGSLLPEVPTRGDSGSLADHLRLRPSTTSLRRRPRSDPLDFNMADLPPSISPISLSPNVEHFIEKAPLPPTRSAPRRTTSADVTSQQRQPRAQDYPIITHTPAEISLNSPQTVTSGYLAAPASSTSSITTIASRSLSASTSASARQPRNVSFDDTPEVTYFHTPVVPSVRRTGEASAAVQRIRRTYSSIDLDRPAPAPIHQVHSLLLPPYPTMIKAISPHLHFWTPIYRREDERGVGQYRTRTSSKSSSKGKTEATHHWRPYAMVLSQVSKPLELSSSRSRFSLMAPLKPRTLPALTTRSYIHLFSMLATGESPTNSPEKPSSTGLSKYNPIPTFINAIHKPRTKESREALIVAKEAKERATKTDEKGSPRHLLDAYGFEEKERREAGIYTWARAFDPLLDTIGTSAIDTAGPGRPDGEVLWHTDDHTKCLIELKFDDGVRGTEVWIIQIPQSYRHLRDEWVDHIAHQRREALQRGFPMPKTSPREQDNHPVGDQSERRASDYRDSYNYGFNNHGYDEWGNPDDSDNVFRDDDDDDDDEDDPYEDAEEDEDPDDPDAKKDRSRKPPPSADRPAPTKGILKRIRSMSNVASYQESGLALHNDKPTWGDMERVIREQEPLAGLVAVKERVKASRAKLVRGYKSSKHNDEDEDEEEGEEEEEQGSVPEPAIRLRRKRELSGQTIRPNRQDDDGPDDDYDDVDFDVDEYVPSPPATSTSALTRDQVIRYWKLVVAVERQQAHSAEKAAAANKAALTTNANLADYIKPITPDSAARTQLGVPDLDKTLSRDTISTDLQTNDSQQSTASNTSTAPSIVSAANQWRPTWEQNQTRTISKKSSTLSIHRRSAAVDVTTATAGTDANPASMPESPGTARSGNRCHMAGNAPPTFEVDHGYSDPQGHDHFHGGLQNSHLYRDDVNDHTPFELSPVTDVDLALPPPLIDTLPPLIARHSNTDDSHTSLPAVTPHDGSSHTGGSPARIGLRKKFSLMASSLISSKRKDERKIQRQKSGESNEGIRGPAPTRATSTTSFPPDPNPLALAPKYQIKMTDTRNPIYLGSVRHYSSFDRYAPRYLQAEDPRFTQDRSGPGERIKKAMGELDARLSLAAHAEPKTWSMFNAINERKALRRTTNDIINGLIATWGPGPSPDAIPRGRPVSRYAGF